MPLSTPINLPTGVTGNLAGGAVVARQTWGFLNLLPIITIPDVVTPHIPHPISAMAAGSPWMSINTFPVCRLGDPASCGHLLAASQDWFRIS